MIAGCKFYNDKSRYCVQTNDPIETFLKSIKMPGYLESCGPNSMINGANAVLDNELTVKVGEYNYQVPAVLFDFLNDPNNFDQFFKIRPNLQPGTIPGNRIPQYYAYAMRKLFSVPVLFQWTLTFNQVKELVLQNKAVQICFNEPAHFVAVVAYDTTKDVLLYNDSWPDRFADRNGFNVPLTRKEYGSNVQTFFNIIG